MFEVFLRVFEAGNQLVYACSSMMSTCCPVWASLLLGQIDMYSNSDPKYPPTAT